MAVSRRKFIETAALTAVAAPAVQAAETSAASKLPQRTLGKTGAKVSILAFGSGSRFLSYKEEDEAAEALNRALKLGITYVDTAFAYGNGKSEERIGRMLGSRRKDLFLATKVSARKADEAMKIIEGSLKRLQTDRVDLLHIHSLGDEADLAAIEAKDGVLGTLLKARDQKMTRFIGITCHTDPSVLKTALERHDFDCTQMALNAALAGMVKGKGALGEPHEHSFESLALPVANRKKMGVIAMKIFAQEGLSGKAPVSKLISYSLSLPVSCAVLGMPKLEHIEENIQVAKAFKPMPRTEMREFSGQLSSAHKARLDDYFAQHQDA